MKFKALLELHGKTATGIEVPHDIVAGLGPGKRHAVVVTIGPHTYRSTVSVYNGKYLLGVSAENRTAAGVSAGDVIEVNLELDAAPREVEVPADFAAALAAEPAAAEAFAAMSYTHRKEHVRAIEEAKTAETRQRRIDKALAMLRERARPA